MVYVLLADGFEEIEAVAPVDIMRRAGIKAVTVSIKPDKAVTGFHGITMMADMTINENICDIDMLILPGGAGHELLDASNDVHSLINRAHVEGAYIAAICAAPSIIGKKMLLEGKKATCYPGFEKYLYGAEYSEDKVVKDGKIITAKGPGAAYDFGFKICEILKDKETADRLKAAMQY